MKKHIITKDQLDADNNYIGEVDLSDFGGAIEAEEGLGCVKIKSIKAKTYILFKTGCSIKAGNGIEAGDGIKAGEGIEAGWDIKAGEGIEAGFDIEAGWGIKAGSDIKAGNGIKAGDGIKAGSSIEAGSDIKAGFGIKAGDGIKAGEGIEAGWSIKAGDGIEAGNGIKAGLRISCKWLSSNLRIFAGLCLWKKPAEEEMQIRCEELRKGEVCFGELVLRKSSEPKPASCANKVVEVEGVKYKLVALTDGGE